MLFKTIMNKESFEKEMKSKKAEQDQIDEQRASISLTNFKLKLIESMVRVNDWVTLDLVLNGLYEGRLDLTISKDGILKQCFSALNWFIEPLFRPSSLSQTALL